MSFLKLVFASVDAFPIAKGKISVSVAEIGPLVRHLNISVGHDITETETETDAR